MIFTGGMLIVDRSRVGTHQHLGKERKEKNDWKEIKKKKKKEKGESK